MAQDVLAILVSPIDVRLLAEVAILSLVKRWPLGRLRWGSGYISMRRQYRSVATLSMLHVTRVKSELAEPCRKVTRLGELFLD